MRASGARGGARKGRRRGRPREARRAARRGGARARGRRASHRGRLRRAWAEARAAQTARAGGARGHGRAICPYPHRGRSHEAAHRAAANAGAGSSAERAPSVVASSCSGCAWRRCAGQPALPGHAGLAARASAHCGWTHVRIQRHPALARIELDLTRDGRLAAQQDARAESRNASARRRLAAAQRTGGAAAHATHRANR